MRVYTATCTSNADPRQGKGPHAKAPPLGSKCLQFDRLYQCTSGTLKAMSSTHDTRESLELRERIVLLLLAHGYTTGEIALGLQCTAEHLTQVVNQAALKLGVSDEQEAVRAALRYGLIPSPPPQD